MGVYTLVAIVLTCSSTLVTLGFSLQDGASHWPSRRSDSWRYVFYWTAFWTLTQVFKRGSRVYNRYACHPCIYPSSLKQSPLAETIGYKYIFIVIVGVAAVAACIGIPFLRETYAPIIQQRLLKKRNDEESHAVSSALRRSRREQFGLLWTNFTRPFVMLSQSLICFVLSLYMALYVCPYPVTF